jgi:nicotinic acid phosphoribosyltransferase
MVETTRVGFEDLGLFTNLYQLTMAQSDFEYCKNRLATFSLCIWKYPLNRTFFVAAGLAIELDDLQQVQFPSAAPAHLRRRLIDVSLRRTHGTDAAMNLARVSDLAGFDSTSTVLAGQRYGLPMAGTMAHLHVTRFPDEIEAFRAVANPFLQ